MGISPTSSRKSVPPSASSKRPTRSFTAPVNEPLAWPKNSLSKSDPGMLAQFTFTKGPRARALCAWTATANTSLPTPDSPSRSTEELVSATA